MEMYDTDLTWKKLQQFLPPKNRLKKRNMPKEYFLPICGVNLHIDHYLPHQPKGRIILFHGVGGNGRLLSFIALPLYENGYEVICPDLPLYGYTETPISVDYNLWVSCGNALTQHFQQDEIPMFLFGLSAGGILAYQVACRCENISGLMVTCLLDQRNKVVTRATAIHPLVATIGNRFLKLFHKPFGNIKLPMKLVSNMKAIVNNSDLVKILTNDKRSSGARVSLSFLYTMLHPDIITEPEDFRKCPVLLAHPEDDKWTDVALSELFFDRLTTEKRKAMLECAGHFPIEPNGLLKLEMELLAFMSLYT